MSCPSGTDDAAYVLGALAPRERLEFERHLAGCDRCQATVRDLAGIPGLLGRIDPSVLEEGRGEVPPLPETLLPALTREAERESRSGRRRLLTTAAAAAAVVVVAATTTTAALVDRGQGAPETSPPSATVTEDPLPALAMTPLGEVPVEATVSLEQVSWGTRLVLDCTYDTGSVSYELPPRVDYVLYVRSRDGRSEQVGSWRSVDGRSMTLDAGTAWDRDEIASVEVRIPDGRVVLRLAV